MGRTARALGPAPTAAVEGPTVEDGPAAEEGLTAEEGPVAAMSAVGDPAAAEEGPTAGKDGPWRTRGLKVWAPLVFSISESWKRAAKEDELKFSDTGRRICNVKMKWD